MTLRTDAEDEHMKKLPVGTQAFRDIIEEERAYIDKTQYIYSLINDAKYYFLSRPRRFGKTLLLDTIAETFSGDKELFKGLFIHDTDYDFKKHPVIRLDMSNIANETPEAFKDSLTYEMIQQAKRENISIECRTPSDMFKTLIEAMYDKYNQRIVVLIDEYDKPILDRITDAKTAEGNRDILHGFYGILKSMEPYLRLTFITGVTKFTKTSIFSGLNNLKDITMSEKYANICGIPTEELETHFSERIEHLKSLNKLKDCGNIVDRILMWYDGYSWDGNTRVINPYSLIKFFDEEEFENFWFSSGTPTFLIDLIKSKPESFLALENLEISEGLLDKYDLRSIEIEPLLFQTGYLTVEQKRYSEGRPSYLLKIPNREVSESLYLSIIADFTEKGDTFAESAYKRIKKSLATGDLQGMLETLRALFSSIPYELHPHSRQKEQQSAAAPRTARSPGDAPAQIRAQAEAYYHSIFYAILSLLGFDIEAEPSTSRGRIDATLEYADKAYVMEFKYTQTPLRATQKTKQKLYEKTLDAAMNQIKEKAYSNKYLGSGKTIHHVALAFLGRDDIAMRAEKA